ncbi:MAG: hypothetical protein RLY16_147 [Bacteroidota bacterium]
MKAAFDFLDKTNTPNEPSLIVQVGYQGVSYVIIDNQQHCHALAVYDVAISSDTTTLCDLLKRIIADNPVLQLVFKKITLVYDFPQTLLVPPAYKNHTSNRQMLELLFGDMSDNVLYTDFMYKHNLYNIFAISRKLDEVLSYLFISDEKMHLQSILPYVQSFSANHLYCIFGNNHLNAMLLVDGKLQVMQSFNFFSPDDAVYFLLQTCNAYQVDPSNVELQLHGRIDQSSVLCREISQYFDEIVFSSLPESFSYSEDVKQLPSHYFSHLFEIAACV